MWLLRLFMLVFAIPMSVYVFRFLGRTLDTFRIDSNAKYAKLSRYIFAVCIGIICLDAAGVAAIMVLHYVMAALMVQFLNFLLKKIIKKKYNEGFSLWKKIYGSGVIPIVAACLLLVYGYYNLHNIDSTYYTINTQKNIRDEGYRVALIADVHFEVSLSYEELLEVCEEISKQDVDIVALDGDIIDDSTSKEGMEAVFMALSTIESEYGIFYTYGNHDRQNYTKDKSFSEKELVETIEGNGIVILQDDIYEINDDFVIVGREDRGFGNSNARMSIEDLLRDVNKEKYILTLDHQPKEYEENGNAGTDLLLSGHTHGGQLWPVNHFLQIVKVDEALYGHTQIDEDSQAIITSGIAGWRYPIKTAAPAEYVIIDIKK